MIDAYIDGSSIGNPGKIGIGYLLYREGKLLKKEGVYLGVGTNNFSEYMACIIALTEVLAMGERNVRMFSDSNLLCQQLRGKFKVKNSGIFPLYTLAQKLISKLESFDISHIGREENAQADKLAREATGFLC